jgi:hypothetical protein
MMVAIAIVLALVALNLFLLYRHSVRDSLAVNEYVQFLLLHPDIYADHRGKFEAYLLTTAAKTPMQRGVDAMKAISHTAKEGRDKLTLANVGARNSVAQRGDA